MNPVHIRVAGRLYRRADTLDTDTDKTQKEQVEQGKAVRDQTLDPSHPASKASKPVIQYPAEPKLSPDKLYLAGTMTLDEFANRSRWTLMDCETDYAGQEPDGGAHGFLVTVPGQDDMHATAEWDMDEHGPYYHDWTFDSGQNNFTEDGVPLTNQDVLVELEVWGSDLVIDEFVQDC